MRQRARRSRRAARPSSASGGSSIMLSPTAWRRQAIGSSLSPACRRANGGACGPRMRSSGCTRSSSEGSRRKPCCRPQTRSEEHTSELQSLTNLVCRLLLEKKKKQTNKKKLKDRAQPIRAADEGGGSYCPHGLATP